MQESVCIKAGTCFKFTIKDSFGDGLTQGGAGGYELYLDGSSVKEGVDFGSKDTYEDCNEVGDDNNGGDDDDDDDEDDDDEDDDDNDDLLIAIYNELR